MRVSAGLVVSQFILFLKERRCQLARLSYCFLAEPHCRIESLGSVRPSGSS